MNRFYGSLTGQAKTTATRRGGTDSGVRAHVRGWDIGVEVWMHPCPYCKTGDAFTVKQTGGNNDPSYDYHLGTYCRNGCEG